MNHSALKAAFLTTVLLFSASQTWAETVVATIPTGVGPKAIAIDSVTNMIYVANFGSRSVTIINGLTNATSTVNVGEGPDLIAVNPATNKIYVAEDSSYDILTIIDGASDTTITLTELYPEHPSAIVMNPITNMLYAVSGSTFSAINGSNNEITQGAALMTSDPSVIALNPVTNMYYVNSGGDSLLTVINGSTNSVTTLWLPSNDAGAVAVNSVTNKIYVSCNSFDATVNVIDGETNEKSAINVGYIVPNAMAVNPVTNMVYVIADGAVVKAINGSTDSVTTIVTSATTQVNYLGIAVNAVTNKIYLASWGSALTGDSLFTIIDGATNTISTVKVGSGPPWAIAVNSLTNMIYVANYGSNNVTVISGLNPPNAPLLSSPSNGALNQPTAIPFSWNTVSGAASYSMQLSTASTFLTTVTNQIGLTTGTSQVTSLSKNKNYYWKVNATNAAGKSAWSSIWSFTVTPTSALPSDHFTLEPSFTINNGTVSYTLNQQSPVEFKIYDIIGRKLFQFNRVQGSGSYSFSIKRLNLPSALYIVQFKAGNIERQSTVLEK